MTELVPRIYLLPADFEAGPFWERVGARFELQPLASENARLVCLDTFDWRLFRRGLSLCRKRGYFFLEDGFGYELVGGSGSRKKKAFWWDLPEGELRDTLIPIIDIRALIEQLSLERSEQRFGLRNSDQKTVLRLMLRQAVVRRIGEGTSVVQPQLLRVEPLRGYPKPFAEIDRILKKSGFAPLDKKAPVLEGALGSLGISPLQNDAAFHLSRGRESTVGEAVSEICLQLKNTMFRNLAGLQADIDTEFLHDFRVAVRRSRSLLTALKKYLPAEDLAFFQAELKWLGTITGTVRDLDVYLLEKKTLQAMLPPLLQPGLDLFFDDIAAGRKQGLRIMRRNLSSERFTQFLASWEDFLLQLPSHSYPGCRRNCLDVVRKVVFKRFRRMLREGGQITAQTPDERLHELRIEGKKLRYMVGFFSSLWDAALVDQFSKQIKRLQSNLGDFNDISVQRRMLAQHLAKLGAGAADVQVAAALGGLIVHLGESQRQVRARFETAFETFSAQESVELLESILINGEGER